MAFGWPPYGWRPFGCRPFLLAPLQKTAFFICDGSLLPLIRSILKLTMSLLKLGISSGGAGDQLKLHHVPVYTQQFCPHLRHGRASQDHAAGLLFFSSPFPCFFIPVLTCVMAMTQMASQDHAVGLFCVNARVVRIRGFVYCVKAKVVVLLCTGKSRMNAHVSFVCTQMYVVCLI